MPLKKGSIPWNKGIHMVHSGSFKKGHSVWVGRSLTDEHRKKIAASQSGEKGNNWRGGVSSINERARKSGQYKQWRKAIFERDDYRCMACGVKGGRLNADHIYPFSQFPRLRFEINNGQTLCVPCHKATDTYGWSLYHKQYAQAA